MTRKELADKLTAFIAYRHTHPRTSVLLSLIVFAACAAGIFLLIMKFPILKLSCFSGGCSN
ncbi:MAG: hypothetical protein COX65_06065 [Elusimicrobia bacterium CG_4_10_14_0_2_um_filter_56_8]|nr:MAG: hypothetical protein AUJ51_08635 [Elusimicrobia bacterium CG1_02_56_21]PJA14089.1 MAG: hypothetical protein COX65_06065 [Elusimicrobia bacterium CG_4_10_14_0_2_um_filter_56_8]